MGAVKRRPFRIDKSSTRRTSKYTVKQSVEDGEWWVVLWLGKEPRDTWDEAWVILYAEMAGTASGTTDLSRVLGSFLLGLEE